MLIRSRAYRPSTFQRLTSAGVLCCMLLASVPLPVSERVVADASSEPYPCQGCGCGCVTARHCWTSCCCHTPAERKAWAKRNGVTPPEYAVLESPEPPQDTRACCRADVSRATERCEGGDNSSSGRDDCGTGQGQQESPVRFAGSADERADSVSWVTFWKAARCRGVDTDWTLLAGALPHSPAVRMFNVAALPQCILLNDEHALARRDAPPAPPPRVGFRS